ncbi:MAG: Enoyl-CoA hydratase/isomerase [Acidimicrobiales bacterium]|nr:Enoyl-CoA hydratase/isomerase [Acidimicrobiales bacterium]
MPEQITCDLEDRILTITLDRPQKLNAFTGVMLAELIEAFERADADDDVRVVIVTGRGRAFCAGADLGEQGGATFDTSTGRAIGAESPDGRHRDGGGLLALRIFAMTKPVIGAINGPAVGVGVNMTLPMDVRLASDSARFGFVFTGRGIVPASASAWFLPRIVGVSRAAEWTFAARMVGAEEALAAGLVRSLHAEGELLPAANELAHEFADNTSAVSVALARQMLWRLHSEPHPLAAHRIDSQAIEAMGQSPDAREGVSAFLERRPPAFGMRPSTDMPDFFPWFGDEPY